MARHARGPGDVPLAELRRATRMPPRSAPRGSARTHRHVDAVRDAELLEGAAAVIGRLFPARGLKKLRANPHVSRSGVSRARNGDATSPLFRLTCWCREAVRQGRPAEAFAVVDWLSAQIEAVRDGAPVSLAELHLAEAEADAAEDAAQAVVLLHPSSPSARAAHEAAALAQIAAGRRLLREYARADRRRESAA